MTNEEKFKAIVERIKGEGWLIEPHYVSVMLIVNYLDQLKKENVTECGFSMTPMGKNIVAICEEFDWKPSNEEIRNFVTEMVEEPDRIGLEFMLIRYRDDRKGLLEEIAKFKLENPQ